MENEQTRNQTNKREGGAGKHVCACRKQTEGETGQKQAAGLRSCWSGLGSWAGRF